MSLHEFSHDELQHELELKVGEIKAMRALATSREPHDRRALPEAEMVPEIIFAGEVLSGDGFEGMHFGIACSWQLIWDDSWILLEVIFWLLCIHGQELHRVTHMGKRRLRHHHLLTVPCGTILSTFT